MQQIGTAIAQINKGTKVQRKTSEQLIKHSKILNALDLMSEPLTENELNKVLVVAKKELEDGLGFKIDENLVVLLKKMFIKDNWTKERLFYSVRRILRNFKYTEKHLKPADFYENSEIKMYGYSEYLDNLNKRGKAFNDEIEWYKLNNIPFYVIKAEVEYELPFERLN